MVTMHAATMTLVGNLASEPEIRTVGPGVERLNFRLAASDRRLDPNSGQWTDVSTVFLKVTCWRALASNVKASMHKGDPVVVFGRLQSYNYVRDEQPRTGFELDAYAIGPNLARGVAIFRRTPSMVAASPPAVVVKPDQDEELVGGSTERAA